MLKAKQTWTIEMVNYELINTTLLEGASLEAYVGEVPPHKKSGERYMET